MKKLLTILGSLSLIPIISFTLIACKTPTIINRLKTEKPKVATPKDEKPKDEKPKEEKLDEKEQIKQPEKTPHNTRSEKENYEEDISNDSKSRENESNTEVNETEIQGDEPIGEAEVNTNPNETEIQGDEPIGETETPKRSKQDNFNLIKKYGLEINKIFSESPDRMSKITTENNSLILEILGRIIKFYTEIMNYNNFNDFEKELKDKLKDKPKDKLESIDGFINKIEEEWNKVIDEYENEEENILKILKS
ncbi:lipoprotein [Mycoplasma feriruminatoris]|uniref:lipoprotein n=1 Tax=Mycoplasma feriruminatoris TaxID=1179777 RepID=UPI00241CA62E|nr:lipoprotein [Mycoplasma feriruminatoris]WFQ90328.1 hypothetical protein MFERI11561_00582 [Mycoplasma feriruminatoris]